jgi:hypothetical protein
MNVRNRKQAMAWMLGASLAMGGTGSWSQNSGVKQDVKTAGHETEHVAKATGHALSKGTKAAYRATENGTRKAWHKTKNTTKGAAEGAKEGAKQ